MSGPPDGPAFAWRRLGRSGAWVSALAFGGAAIGGLFEPVDEARAIATVDRAYRAGLRYLDTAPHYGLGLSEVRLGVALRGLDRGSFTLSSKVGRLVRPVPPGVTPDPEGYAGTPEAMRVWDFSAEGIRRSIAESLARLGTDRLDVVYIHDPDEHEEQVYATAYPALARLRDEGVVSAIGVGMNQAAMPARFVRRLDLDVVLCAGRYTLLDQSALAELLPACAARGTSVVIGGVYNSGLLADPRPGARFDYAPADDRRLAAARELRRVCDRHGVPLRAAALAFPLAHPSVAGVLVGCRSPAEVDDNVAMARTPVPAALWAELRERGLLPAHAPVPGTDDTAVPAPGNDR